MNDQSASVKLIEELLRFVDDGTITEDERSIVTQAIESNSLSEDDAHAGLIDQLQAAMQAVKLPGEKQATDKTLIQTIVQQLRVQGALGAADTTQASSGSVREAGWTDDDFDLSGQSFGSYLILQLIGRGGMGVVYEATDQLLHRHVALKVMLPTIAARPQNRARFLREARAAASVEHENICPIYQVGEDRGTAFIAMPLLAGETLESRLRQRRLTPEETINIIEQVVLGLDAAHQVGLIHRDIKPANVWLEKRKDASIRVRLLDFGLAQMETEDPALTQPGAIMGTPSYMAPEQARGETVDARSDLFSVGAVLYELLTGRKAFEGRTPASVLSSIMTDHPKAPALIDNACPKCLSDLTLRLLEKNPSQRFPDATTLSEALANCRRLLTSAAATDSDVQHSNCPAPNATAVELVSNHREVVATQPARTRTEPVRWTRWWPLLVAAGFAGLIWAGILVFQTSSGTLVVETSDDARVLFEKGELQVLDEDGKVKYRLNSATPSETVQPGKYRVQVVGADGLTLSTEEFTIRRHEKTVLKVTAAPPASPSSVAPAESPVPEAVAAASVLTSFRGKVIFAADFTKPNQWPVPLVDDTHTTSYIENETLIYQQRAHSPENPFLTIPLEARLNRGACALRCKTLHGAVFFNFGLRHTGKNSRNYSLGINNGNWNLFIQRQDMEDNAWKNLKATILASAPIRQPGLAKDHWLDLAFRWSEKDYAVWLDGQRIAGGTLPSEELKIGHAEPAQIGLRTAPDLLPRLEIDAIALWDQGDIALDDAQVYQGPKKH